MIGFAYEITNEFNGEVVRINVDASGNQTAYQKDGYVLTDYPAFDLDVRNEERAKAGQHGIWDFDSYYGKRIMTFQGLLVGIDRTRLIQFREQLKRVFSLPAQPTSSNNGYVKIKWTDTAGDIWTFRGKIQQDITFTRAIGIRDTLNFFVSLKAESPWVLSEEQFQETSVMGWRQGALILPTPLPNTINIIYNNLINIYQNGSADAPAIYRLYGESVNPKITRFDETVNEERLVSNFSSGWTGGIIDTVNSQSDGIARKLTSTAGVQATMTLPGNFNLDVNEDISGIVVSTDIKGYWKFNNNALDSSGLNHSGVFENGANASNTYLTLDGVNQYVSVADSDDFSFGDGLTDTPFSMVALVRMINADDFEIISKGVSVSGHEYLFASIGASKKLTLRLYDSVIPGNFIGRNYSVSLSSVEGEWTQVVATYDGSGTSAGIKLYINGSRVDDADDNNGSYTAMDNGAEDVYFGRHDTDYAEGDMDDVLIYSDELTAIQIQNLYYNTVEWVSMFMYIDNVDNIALGDYLTGENYIKFIENAGVDEFVIELQEGNMTLRNGWNYFRILKDAFEMIGNPSWNDIITVELSIKAKAGAALNITFDNLYVKGITFTENKLELTTTLASGEYADFDVLNGTIIKSDGADLSGFLTLDSNWFYIKPKNNCIMYESDTNPLVTWVEPTQRVDIFWYDAFL